MYKKITSTGFNPRTHLHILKTLFIFINVLILLLYGCMLAIFNEFPFDAGREAMFVLNMLGMGTAVSFAISVVFMLRDALYCLIHKRKQMQQAALPDYNNPGSVLETETGLAI